ncbi:MAG: glutathione S-transferase family protein [Cellvibrionaceae bacterium]
MKLVIGNKNYSSWSLRPWLLLRFHGVPFEEVRVALFREDTRENLARYTDAGKVPVLHDNDLVVWDSLAICEYVSEHYLNGKGWPAAVKARAEARSASAEMHSGFAAIRGNLPMNCKAVNRKITVDSTMQAEIKRVDQLWSTLRSHYSEQGPWLFGSFSIADCMFAPMVSRFRSYGIPVSSVSAEYMDRILTNEHINLWYRQGREETEIIDNAEVGQ